MASLQEAAYGEAADYENGSPHLAHPQLRNRVIASIREVVLERMRALGRCRVLEVGAGHGAFTDHVLALGAEVTITEMSRPMCSVLRRRLEHNALVSVHHDPDGEELFRQRDRFDVVLFISVLHHIPDYLEFLSRIVDRVTPGGSLLSYQDPLFYPRRSWLSLKVDRTAFLMWRVFQGELRRGLATQMRRWRGTYDETALGDMVEYHVVRQGVDEEAIVALLGPRFANVSLIRYWSSANITLQRLGERTGAANTFGLLATGRRNAPHLDGSSTS